MTDNSSYELVGTNNSTSLSEQFSLLESGKLIQTNDSIEALNLWLSRYQHSKHTFRNYKKEIERFVLWLANSRGRQFHQTGVEDVQAYLYFLLNPTNLENWLNNKKTGKNSNNWRPFSKPLSLSSCHQTYLVLNSAFGFLMKSGFFLANPCLLVNKSMFKGLNQKDRVERYLSQDNWAFVLEFINSLAKNSRKERYQFERVRFLFRFLYFLSPRLSEVANCRMNDFVKLRDKWWWQVVGKGQKKAKVPVNDAMLASLIEYRRFLGLTDYPSYSENQALIMNSTGKFALGPSMIYKIVKKIFKEAALELEKRDPDSARILAQASTHWLRHTSLTHQADQQLDIRYIQANARHSSIETTQRYLHIEEEQWHSLNQEILKKT